MRYEMMFPKEIRKAIDENWPVVIAGGVLEYHAEHLNVGVDTVLVVRALEELEKEMNLVIMPPFYYGAGSYVVDKPERNGTMHVDPDGLVPFARQFFRSLLRIGFRNIHMFIHHQSENFTDGMPTDLSFKLAARQEIFAFQEWQRGENWWGDDSQKDYYDSHTEGENPFNWICIHPFMDAAAQDKFPIDHAGEQETSLMMAFCPEGVKIEDFDQSKWFAASATKATPEMGAEAKRMTLDGMRKILS